MSRAAPFVAVGDPATAIESHQPAGVTERLATWCADLKPADLPEPVADAARLLMLDSLGCGLFGSTTPWGRVAVEHVLEAGAGAEATVWGVPGTLVPAVNAPLANGALVHCFELDDLHAPAIVHGTAQVVPVAFAVAELRARGAAGGRPSWLPTDPVTPGELLAAVAVGLEASARIGLLTGARQLGRGFHPSPNVGVFGAAAVAGRLLGFDAAHMADAFGIAGSGGGALMAAQYGASVKRLHPGFAAQAGVRAAMLAARGVTGTPAVIESPYGGFAHTHGGDDAVRDAEQVVAGLGATWEVPRFGVKAYPCCGSNHTSIDAYLSLLAEHTDLTAKDVERIDVECSTLTLDHVGWPWRGGSVTAAQMSLPYTLAVLAIDQRMGVEQFSLARVDDPDVAGLAQRVHLRAAADIDAGGREGRHSVRLTVTTSDGRELRRSVQHARGQADKQLTADEIVAKYRDLAGHVLTDTAVADVQRLVLGLRDGDGDGRSLVHRLSAALTATQRNGQP